MVVAVLFAMPLREDRVKAVIGEICTRAPPPVVGHAIDLVFAKLAKIDTLERRPVEETEAALIWHQRQ